MLLISKRDKSEIKYTPKTRNIAPINITIACVSPVFATNPPKTVKISYSLKGISP